MRTHRRRGLAEVVHPPSAPRGRCRQSGMGGVHERTGRKRTAEEEGMGKVSGASWFIYEVTVAYGTSPSNAPTATLVRLRSSPRTRCIDTQPRRLPATLGAVHRWYDTLISLAPSLMLMRPHWCRHATSALREYLACWSRDARWQGHTPAATRMQVPLRARCVRARCGALTYMQRARPASPCPRHRYDHRARTSSRLSRHRGEPGGDVLSTQPTPRSNQETNSRQGRL